jgi:ABC-type polysaccharide/polyol phosphate transport system ATPase subunit
MVRCFGLSKEYPLGARPSYRALRDSLVLRRRERAPDTFLALDDVTCSFPAGEVTGIIGRNGAGKSTLLKILSRVTRPSAGSAEIDGTVGSLLEVGTGFHPELTGRENVYFQGAVLGMRKRDIDRRFDQIVEFAGVERFLDLPVKRFSSGMYLRLAFAVGAHLDTDVLLVDEVLAVGDAEFQKRCLGKMRDVTEGGRTVLFVSHHLNAVQRLCERTVLLDRGRVVADGPTGGVIEQYLAEVGETAPGEWIDLSTAQRRGTGEAVFTGMRVVGQPMSEAPFELEVEIVADGDRVVPSLAAGVRDRYGTKLVNCDSTGSAQAIHLRDGTNRLRLRVDELHLNGGLYTVSLWLASGGPLDRIEAAATIEVLDRPGVTLGVRPANDGVVVADYSWTAIEQISESEVA